MSEDFSKNVIKTLCNKELVKVSSTLLARC